MRETYAQSIRANQLSNDFNGIGPYAPEHTLGPTTPGPRLTAKDPERAAQGAAWHTCIIDAWGVKPKAAPGGQEPDSC